MTDRLVRAARPILAMFAALGEVAESRFLCSFAVCTVAAVALDWFFPGSIGLSVAAGVMGIAYIFALVWLYPAWWLVSFVVGRERYWQRVARWPFDIPPLVRNPSQNHFCSRRRGAYEVALFSLPDHDIWGYGRIARFDWFNPNYHNLTWEAAINRIRGCWRSGNWGYVIIDSDDKIVYGPPSAMINFFPAHCACAGFGIGAIALIFFGVLAQ